MFGLDTSTLTNVWGNPVFRNILMYVFLLGSGAGDLLAFWLLHKAFELDKPSGWLILAGNLAFGLLGGGGFTGYLWAKHGYLSLPLVVEFLSWQLVANVGMLMLSQDIRTFAWHEKTAVITAIASIGWLIYRRGGA